MKVAVVMERIEVWRGGAETSTLQFAGHLARLGCDLTIVTTSPAQSTPAYSVMPINAPSRLRGTRTLSFIRRATAWLRENPFDIVHAITPCPIADVYQPRGGTLPETLLRNRELRRAALQKSLKHVGQMLTLKYRVTAAQERKLLTRQPPPWVIAISRYVSRQLVQHYRFSPDRIRLIFNGVDPDDTPGDLRAEDRRRLRQQFGLVDRDVMALCVAHNFKLKGVAKLIEALAMTAATPPGRGRLVTVIVGRDDPTGYVRMAEQLGVTGRVIFAGPTQRMQTFYHAADFLVHPTYYDPCSRVVLEALGAGIPVVTTALNGASEVIRDGQEGFVIESPNDVTALATRMQILTDAEKRREMARLAPRAVEGLSMARHAAEVLRLYEDILRERSGRA